MNEELRAIRVAKEINNHFKANKIMHISDYCDILRESKEDNILIKKSVEKAIRAITGMGVWSSTKEGHKYWSDVTKKLENYLIINP